MVRPLDSFSCNFHEYFDEDFDEDFDIHDVIKKLKQYDIYDNVKIIRINDIYLDKQNIEEFESLYIYHNYIQNLYSQSYKKIELKDIQKFVHLNLQNQGPKWVSASIKDLEDLTNFMSLPIPEKELVWDLKKNDIDFLNLAN